MILSPNDCSSPTPITPAHVLMRIIHQLFVPHILWAPQFPTLHRKHKKQRRNLIYSHEKPTVYADTNPAPQTFSPRLGSTKHLQMAPGGWSLALKQWEEMWCLKKKVQLENNSQHAQWVLLAIFLTDYIFISWEIFRGTEYPERNSRGSHWPSLPSLSPFPSTEELPAPTALCAHVYLLNQAQQQQQVKIFTMGKGERSKFRLWSPTSGEAPAWLTECEYW